MSTRNKRLNLEVVRTNVAEAIKQLRELERRAAEGDLPEYSLQIALYHASYHLRFAWEHRRVTTTEYNKITRGKLETSKH